MIVKIFDLYEADEFDFRTYSYPEDELAYLFDEWVPYYRMKHAICKSINPKSILEIGVRYGYSAIAFLKAVPTTKYIGVDNDSDTFGGATNAIQWARKITHEYNADFIIGDTQAMDKLPGDHWDLIHIDGQQDGEGTFHDLELAIKKATWILVDGYFWSNENMFASTHFMKKYSQFIEYAAIIPGYAGDLLIKVHKPPKERGQTYLPLSSEYDKEYFEQDCGGYASFKRTQGRRLEDSRLIAPYLLVKSKRGLRILDIGCGRGELCYALAQKGADVTGIDYSEEAIEIARKTFTRDNIQGSLSFICGDAATFPLEGTFDVIIATDFLEHVETSVLKRILKKCGEKLSLDGRLILHTAPNLQYYSHYYPEVRQKAKEAGCYLPSNPRSYYEDLMHINEQTPDSIEALLSGVFNNFVIWVVPEGDMIGSLGSEYTEQMINASKGIFAVASHDSLSKDEMLSLLTQETLDRSKINVEVKVSPQIGDMVAGKAYHLNIWIENKGDERLASLLPYPVHIAYHWKDQKDNFIVYDGIRSSLILPLEPLESRMFEMLIIPPPEPGKYFLEITLVQESCFWFEEMLAKLPTRVECVVQ
jgi:2-polyprenyl-3-methyl-5-hydroxy-6-metoxy-1,4-benzoquinol methylase